MFMLIFIGVSLSSCFTLENDNITVEKKEINFTDYSEEYDIKSDKLTAYFINNEDVVYFDVETFIVELSGLFDTNYIVSSMSKLFKQLTLSSDILGVRLRIIFNFENDYILADDPYAFSITTVNETTDYSRLLKLTDSKTNISIAQIKFDCKSLGYDFYYYNGLVLVPYSLMNFLFCSTNYYNIYYNGYEFYGDYLIISEKDKLNEVYDSSLVGKNQTLSERDDNYKLLKFIMKYYYGLGSKLEKVEEMKEEFLSTDPKIYTKAYYEFINLYLNENHSGVIRAPYGIDYANYDRSKYRSEASEKSSNAAKEIKASYNTYFPDGNNDVVRFYNDLAVITCDSFETGANDDIFNADGSLKDDAYLYDTFYLFKYGFDKIEENGNIKDVIINLSLNGGGNLGALIRSISLISKNNDIIIGTCDYLSGRIVSYKYSVDVNENGNYDISAYANKYNFYILDSVYTYSSANIFSGISQKNGWAKVIGEKSGGGACSIIPLVFPDGMVAQISGTSQNLIFDSESYENLSGYDYCEAGIDLYSAKYALEYKDYSNDEALYNLIHQ